jgi:hypothetical protein
VTTPDIGRSTVRWVTVLYVGSILLQRFAVPGLPVALILPLVLLGAAWGVAFGLAEFNRVRMIAWLLAASTTAIMFVIQTALLDRNLVSLGSWGLFMTVWMPFTLQLVDRRVETYLRVLRNVVATTSVLAFACVVMMLTQFAGLPYRDWMAQVVPSSWLLEDFVITYPISYGSSIYRANAWIGLEPSMVSLQLGVALVAALVIGARSATVALLFAGLVAATSGSGLAVLVVAIVVLLASSARRQLRRYFVPSAVVLALGVFSPMGQSIVGRLGEGTSEQSSTSLRAIYPYRYLWPDWATDFIGVVFGFGPGSSQRLVDQSGIMGLLVPSPIKIFFDYGLLAGVVLAVMILLCFVGGHSRSLAVSLFVSLWTLQPGTTTILVVIPVLLLVTWWSPRPAGRPALEDVFDPGRLDRSGRPDSQLARELTPSPRTHVSS